MKYNNMPNAHSIMCMYTKTTNKTGGGNNNLEKTNNTAFCFHRIHVAMMKVLQQYSNKMYSSLFLIINIILSSNQHNNNVV